MNGMNPKVDDYLRKAKKWRQEIEKLREIVLGCQLDEALKWGKPCYTFQGSNVVILQGFKEYCALMFFNGAVLKDPRGLLVKIGENTQTGRQIRFTNVGEIVDVGPILKDYIREAVEAEKAGLKVELKKTADYPVPEEFQNRLNANPALKVAFEGLTQGRQRAYLLYFAAPKQSRTRESRVEKYTQQILSGKGLNDR